MGEGRTIFNFKLGAKGEIPCSKNGAGKRRARWDKLILRKQGKLHERAPLIEGDPSEGAGMLHRRNRSFNICKKESKKKKSIIHEKGKGSARSIGKESRASEKKRKRRCT